MTVIACLICLPGISFSVQAQILSRLSVVDVPSNTIPSLNILYHRKFKDGFGIDEVERQLIEKFASKQGLKTVWIEVEEKWELLPALHRGEGDLIVSESYDVSGGMQGYLAYTDVWAANKQQAVGRDNGDVIRSLADLTTRQVAIKRSSPVWQQVLHLAEQNNLMELLVLSEEISEELILSRVSSGFYDVAILDGDYIKDNIGRFPELKVSLNLTAEEKKLWAVDAKNVGLQKKLNAFLNKQHLSLNKLTTNLRDLPEIKQHGSLRAITFQSPSNVFYQKGGFKGFEYELIQSFAKDKGLELDVVFAKSEDEMYQLLNDGKGDVITAFIPEENRDNEKYKESLAYYYSSPVLIGRDRHGTQFIDVYDLEGRSLALSSESPYIDLLEEIRDKYQINFQIKKVSSSVNTEALLFMVSMGMYDLTVIPSHQVKAELSRQINLKAHLHLAEPKKNVWLVRQESTQLNRALDKFIVANYRKTKFNSLRKKYITNPKTLSGNSSLLTKISELTPYDSIIRQAAKQHGFDWRLIAAQMYQESRFNPNAVSFAGAEGLMQLMPGTAGDLGVKKIEDPVENIEAGVRYLKELHNKFETELLLEEKTWFALAAYNAGYQRVKYARQLAKNMDLDPSKWFGNVEQAMIKMTTTKSGNDGKMICNCNEAIAYVRDIRTRYKNYVSLTDVTEVALR